MTEIGLRVPTGFHPITDGIERIGRLDRPVFSLIVLDDESKQIEAIRRNKSCTLTLDKAAGKIVGQQGCLLSGDRMLPENIALDYTGAAGEIKYGIRGNTTTNKSILLKVKDNLTYVRCLTISAPLVIIRLGSYNPVTNSCERLTN